MLDRLKGLFGKKPVRIAGTKKLEEGHSKKVSFGDPLAGTGADVVLCRVNGTLYALDAACPHAGGRIMDGPLADGKFAVCPLHMYKFDPASGKPEGAVCKNAKTYKVKEVGEDCDLWL